MKYKKHIFVCTNQRQPGAARVCCGEAAGLEIVTAFKKLIKDNGTETTVRAQRAGCFDICETGPNVVVYPEGVFYGKVQPADVEEIFREHIVNGRPVERLKLHFEK